MSKTRFLKGIITIAMFLLVVCLSGCESSTPTYSYSSSYESSKEAYDAKYGKGAYESDKAFLDSLEDRYNEMIGR